MGNAEVRVVIELDAVELLQHIQPWVQVCGRDLTLHCQMLGLVLLMKNSPRLPLLPLERERAPTG